ncbi:LAQU0S04e02960g1_1 [Lachancea quebecensis]|uniref:LAQU0S04e02960g1_1 n=1 Tax=Lachancea quebecensis TaxID=1654605 RepID=A0A0P1KXS0_9SACH|nr:LAQU0S04e02960g1_1 [Lachancea quebecensis]
MQLTSSVVALADRQPQSDSSAMLVLHELPLQIPAEPHLSPELSLLRQDAARAVESGSDTSAMNKFDVHLNFASALLKSRLIFPDPELDDLICIVVVNMAFFCQQSCERLVQKAYLEGSKEAWSSSGNYNKKAIGLLKFLISLKIPNTTSLLGMVQTYIKCWTLSQQLSVVIFSLSKLRSQICGSSSAGFDRYERLLEFQESDIKDLAKASLLYARLCIGCRETCSQLANTNLSSLCEPLHQYLEALTFVLMSLDCYKNDECGKAIGMLEAATDCLAKGLISNKQLKLIQETKKLKGKIASKFKELKTEGSKLQTKLKLFKRSTPTDRGELHPFLQSTLEDFIIPLMVLLHHRYVNTNDKVFFQPVVNQRDELTHSWPQGKTPELVGTAWVFDGEQLKENSPANSEYF